MKCPRCRLENQGVIDSCYSDRKRAVYRRRECWNCGYRFSTYERWDGKDENGDDGRTFQGRSVYPVNKLKKNTRRQG